MATKRNHTLTTAALLLALAGTGAPIPFVAAPSAHAQNAAKIIQGKVYDAGSTPVTGAIVYLQDSRTNVIKTFISTSDGSYRFGQLPADTDYKIWAQYKGGKSKSKAISSFDTKLQVTIDFHIDE